MRIYIIAPPSTGMTAPVMYEARSLARNRAPCKTMADHDGEKIGVGNYLKINVNTVPETSLLVREIVPLCSLMIWRERLSPIPVPSCLVV